MSRYNNGCICYLDTFVAFSTVVAVMMTLFCIMTFLLAFNVVI